MNPDAAYPISYVEAEYIATSLRHVPLVFASENRPKLMYIDRDQALLYAGKMGFMCSESSAYFWRKLKSFSRSIAPPAQCNCTTHCNMQTMSPVLRQLCIQLQQHDCTVTVNDQDGAQLMTSLLQYVGELAQLNNPKAYSKATHLKTGCSVNYKGTTYTYHCISNYCLLEIFASTSICILVGEVESSPVAQMVLAALGHLANSYINMIIGLALSKSLIARIFLFKKGNLKNEGYVGPVTIERVTTQLYDLRTATGVRNI